MKQAPLLFALLLLGSATVRAAGDSHGGDARNSERDYHDLTSEEKGTATKVTMADKIEMGFPYQVPANFEKPPEGTAVINFPEDRCQPGTITFGDTQCWVMGHGFGGGCTDPASEKKPNGNTPKTDPSEKFTLVDHKIGNKVTWGEVPAIAIEGKMEISPGDAERAGVVLHAVKSGDSAKMPGTIKTAGCPRVNSACLVAINLYLAEHDGKLAFEIKSGKAMTPADAQAAAAGGGAGY